MSTWAWDLRKCYFIEKVSRSLHRVSLGCSCDFSSPQVCNIFKGHHTPTHHGRGVVRGGVKVRDGCGWGGPGGVLLVARRDGGCVGVEGMASYVDMAGG